jgi:hypothetical protein
VDLVAYSNPETAKRVAPGVNPDKASENLGRLAGSVSDRLLVGYLSGSNKVAGLDLGLDFHGVQPPFPSEPLRISTSDPSGCYPIDCFPQY